jgi:hypothetical protein
LYWLQSLRSPSSESIHIFSFSPPRNSHELIVVTCPPHPCVTLEAGTCQVQAG